MVCGQPRVDGQPEGRESFTKAMAPTTEAIPMATKTTVVTNPLFPTGLLAGPVSLRGSEQVRSSYGEPQNFTE